MIFLNGQIIPIEIKFSKGYTTRPVWNSNLPKHNGFYIFGSYGKKEITIFKGEFILSIEARNKLLDFWEKPKVLEKKFKSEMRIWFFHHILELLMNKTK